MKNKSSDNIMIDYFAANLWQLWALVVIVCLILEITSGDFFILCFSSGALVSAVIAAVGGSFAVQLEIFAVVSVLSLFFIRPRLVKRLHGKRRERLSNADALIGRVGKVSEAIESNGYGRVAIDGDRWKAVSENGDSITAGEKVEVLKVDSIILTVRKV